MPSGRRSCHGYDFDAGVEFDVLSHRMPDRTVLLVREFHGALDRLQRRSCRDGEGQIDSREALRVRVRALAAELGLQGTYLVPSLEEDVDDINGHAAGQRGCERDDRRRSGLVPAVKRPRMREVCGRKRQAFVPCQPDNGCGFVSVINADSTVAVTPARCARPQAGVSWNGSGRHWAVAFPSQSEQRNVFVPVRASPNTSCVEHTVLSASALQQFLHERFPLSKTMGVEVVAATTEGVTLSAPLAPNVNHHDTVFGGSASAVAILSAWALLYLRLKDAHQHWGIVIQRNTMNYERPITTGSPRRPCFRIRRRGADSWAACPARTAHACTSAQSCTVTESRSARSRRRSWR